MNVENKGIYAAAPCCAADSWEEWRGNFPHARSEAKLYIFPHSWKE